MSKEEVVHDGKKSGSLKVTIVGCSGLESADKNGFSDPYVRIRIRTRYQQPPMKQKEWKTEIVKKSLNPVYNAEFQLSIRDADSQFLYVEIFDWDRMTKDDILGFFCVPLNYVVLEKTLKIQEFPIKDGSGTCCLVLEGVDFGGPEDLLSTAEEMTLKYSETLNDLMMIERGERESTGIKATLVEKAKNLMKKE